MISRERLRCSLDHKEPDRSPLDRPDLLESDIRRHPWPYPADPRRIAGLRQQAAAYRASGYGVVLKDPFAGIFEMAQRILGLENCLTRMAAGMEPLALKRDFGEALVYWGGGVDTQGVLPNGTPEQVKDDVRRNIEALAPGGFVFNTVHNIQADVPAENALAMWAALGEYGGYI